MAPLPQHLSAPSDVHHLGFRDGAVLVDLERDRTAVLNVTAAAAWLAGAQGSSPTEIVAELARVHHTTPDAITDEVDGVLAQLLAEGWLGDGDTATPGTAPRVMGCAPDEPRAQVPEPHLDHWHLPIPFSPCQASLDRLPWASQVALRVDRFHIGVRCDTPETATVVRHLLVHHVVDDPDVPAAFSLVLGPAGDDGPFARRGLYEGRTWVTSTGDPAAVLGTLLARLSALCPAPPQVLRLAAAAVDHDGALSLVLHPRGTTLPSAALGGGRLASPSPVALAVDGGSGTVELLDGWTGLDIDVSALARVQLSPPPGGRVQAIAARTSRRSTAQTCADLVPLVHTAPDDDHRGSLDLLADLVHLLVT